MKALVKFAKGREGMAIKDIPIPEPQEGEVRLRIKGAAICGSDLHSMFDERALTLPVTLGHEFVGVIDKVCGDSCGLQVGDWVTGLPAAYSCGVCEQCKKGNPSLCKKRGSVGSQRNGAMAEYMIIPASFCFKLPDGLTDEERLEYASAEPLVCTIRGVYERIDVKPGDVAVISGPGTLGLFTLQALKARGAYVIVSGLPQDRQRLEKALEIGADAIAESYEELEAAVKAVSPEGADIACEAAGVAPSLEVCIKIARVHGQILQIGYFGKPITVPVDTMFHKELYFTTTNSTARSTWPITIDLLAQGKIKLGMVPTLKLPIEEWNEGFDHVINKTAYKVILIP